MQKEAIIFDLNGVLLKFNIIDFIRCFFSYRKKWQLLWFFLHPQRAYRALLYAFHEPVVEAGIMKLVQEYPALEEHKNYMLDAINCQRIRPGALQLLEELSNQQKKYYALTNIGEHSIERLQRMYPQLFDLFDKVFYTTAATNYLCKPQRAYFEHHLKPLQSMYPYPNCLYIDDDGRNVQTAAELGMKTVQFKGIDSLKHLLMEETR